MSARSLITLPRHLKLGATSVREEELYNLVDGFVTQIADGLKEGRPFAEVVRAAAARHEAAAMAFHVDGSNLLETFALRDEHTFAGDTSYKVSFINRASGEMLALDLDRDNGQTLRALLCMCASGQFTAAKIRSTLDGEVLELFDELDELGMVVVDPAPRREWIARAGTPSVTRLQHASLLYRGRSASVMVDPHVQSRFETQAVTDSVMRTELEDRVDAILISHSHGDHFHLPTLMTFPADTPIVVPSVPRATMLCPDFADVLRTLGFTRVIPLAWNDPPFVVGDLEIHALPFYGEQPLVREAPRHPALRNHGNTYVVRCSDYTSWFLIDSGDDATGRMADLAHDVKKQFGGIDFLLSNLRPFHILDPAYITGTLSYWLSLTPDQMSRFRTMGRDSVTLGPKGVAEVCKAVGARHYLPYAHWFGNLGGAPADEEAGLTKMLSTELSALGAETRIVPWHIGDTYVPGRPAERAVLPFAP